MVDGVLSYSASTASRSSAQSNQQSNQADGSAPKATAATSARGGPTRDTVTLSSAAKRLIAAASAPAGKYQALMPTRDGFSSANLAAGVTDPGAEPFSGGKSFAQVATAARAELDKQYAAMQASGTPFDYDSNEGKDWYSLFGNLDRRALTAVRENEGGQFTKQEQDIAESIMHQQQGLAMGLFNGPTRLEASFVDPFAGDEAGRQMANIAFLDAVSDDEKATISWSYNRAAAQTAVKWDLEVSGPTNIDLSKLESESPLVKLISAAMDTMRDVTRSQNKGHVGTVDDLKRQPWFKGFEDQLDPAIAATKALYQGIASAA